MAPPRWWQYRPANQPRTGPGLDAISSVILDARRQQEEELAAQQTGGGGNIFGKVFKAGTKPIIKAGEFTLDKLEDYERRFVRPTAIWGGKNLSVLNREIGSINIGNIFQEGPVFQRGQQTIFGVDFSDAPDINPLDAYMGDDEEIERASKYFEENLPLSHQLILGTVFDPSNWLLMGTGAAGKAFATSGIKLLGASGESAANLRKVLNARETTDALRKSKGLSIIGGDKETAQLIENIARETGVSLTQKEAARIMIGAGSLLNFTSGVPEIMFDNFLRSVMRPIGTKVPIIPALKLTQDAEGARLGVDFRPIGKRSARTEADLAFRDTANMLQYLNRRALTNLGDDSFDYDLVAQDIIKQLTDPNLEVNDFFGKHALDTIRKNSVDMTPFVKMAEDGENFQFIARELATEVKAARLKELGIASKELVDKVRGFKFGGFTVDSPAFAKLVAKAAGYENGRRFYNSKLAATWLNGVLWSPWYATQNIVTNALSSGWKGTMHPKLNSLAYGVGPSNLMESLLLKTGYRSRLELDDLAEELGKTLAGQHVLESSEYGGIIYAAGGRRLSRGYIIENSDNLAEALRSVPYLGDKMRDALIALPRLPRGVAQATDENSLRGVWEYAMGHMISKRAATSADPVIAHSWWVSNEIYDNLIKLGVDKHSAKAVSLRYLTAPNQRDFQAAIREIADINPAQLMGGAFQNDNFFLPQNIFDDIVEAASQNPDKVGRSVDRMMRENVPIMLAQNILDTRQFARESIQGMIADTGGLMDDWHRLSSDMFDSLDDTTTAHIVNRSRSKGGKTETGIFPKDKIRKNDVKLWGDVVNRQAIARQSHNLFMTKAVEAYNADPQNFATMWRRATMERDQSLHRITTEMDDFYKDIDTVRKEIIGGTGRKAWGDFKAKYEPRGFDTLPIEPDMDMLATGVRGYQNFKWNEFFNYQYRLHGIDAVDTSIVTEYMPALFDNMNLAANKINRSISTKAARTNDIVAEGQRVIRENPKRWNKGSSRALEDIVETSNADAMDMAVERMGDFFSGATNLDELLSWWVPFSRFGTRAMSMSLRTAARYPPLIPLFYRWSHASEREMSPIPGYVPVLGDLWANPLGATAQFQLFEGFTGSRRIFGDTDIEKLQSSLGLIGLSPGPGAAFLARNVTGQDLQGSLFPGQRATTQPLKYGVSEGGLTGPFANVINAFSSIPGAQLPENVFENAAKFIYGEGQEPQLERETMQVLADRGFDPLEVPKDSEDWLSAQQEAVNIRFNNYFLAGATLREIPQERIDYTKRTAAALAEENIPLEEQLKMRRKGDSPWNRLNREQADRVIQQIGEEEFNNRTNIQPFGLNREQRQVWRTINTYYALSNTAASELDNEILSAGKLLMEGSISGSDYRERRSNAFQNFYAVLDAQKRGALAPTMGNDVFDTEKWSRQDINLEFENLKTRLKAARGSQVDKIVLPEDVALDIYRNIDPSLPQFTNPITGETDWDTWATARELFIETQPTRIRNYIERVNQQREERDPVEKLFSRAKEVMDTYQSIPRFVGMSEEDTERATEALDFISAMQDLGATSQQALFTLAQKDPTLAVLAKLAQQRYNSERTQFWQENPILSLFFSDSILPEEASALGLPTRETIAQ